MKEIKIQVPDGYVIDSEKSTPTNIVFKKISSELPQSWEDYCLRTKSAGYYIRDNSAIDSVNATYTKHVHRDKNLLNTKKDAEAHLALMQIHVLRDVYRQGWKPSKGDYGVTFIYCNDRNESKTFKCYFERFISFQSHDIAKEFSLNFVDLLDKAKGILVDVFDYE